MQLNWIQPYPALPEDTRQSARLVYGQENSYIKMGDSLDILLRVLISPNSKPFSMVDNSFETTIQCAMLTIFQFLEILSNKQMVEAAHSRVEIKYALHLPLIHINYANFAGSSLRMPRVSSSFKACLNF